LFRAVLLQQEPCRIMGHILWNLLSCELTSANLKPRDSFSHRSLSSQYSSVDVYYVNNSVFTSLSKVFSHLRLVSGYSNKDLLTHDVCVV
jgi:hypothetical protein